MLVLALSLAVACSGRTVERDRAAGPGGLGGQGTRLLVAEQRGGRTEFASLVPEEPAARQLVGAVAHDPAWGVRAAVSPDGRFLAVTAMPAGGRDPDREARLLLLDRAERRQRVLLSGVDLRVTPVWAGNDAILIGRVGMGRGEIVLADLGGKVHVVSAAGAGSRLFPAAASPDGSRLYIARYAGDATTIETVSRAGRMSDRAVIGSGVARGFSLSADGKRLAFLGLEAGADGHRYRAATLDLESGALRPAWPEHDRSEDTGVVWFGQTLAVSSVGPAGAMLLAGEAGRMHPRAGGFDALVNGSADGRWLAARGFEAGTPTQPGREWLELIGADGRRVVVPANGAVAIGWLA